METVTTRREFRYAIAVASVVAFWSAAAVVLIEVQRMLGTSPGWALVVKIAVVFAAAFAFMHVSGREATLEESLLAGIAWATLSIATEMFAVTHLGADWHPLLGPVGNAAYRNILLLTWIGAPALFAQRRS